MHGFGAATVLRQLVPAVTGETSQPCGVSEHDAPLRHVSSDDGAGADHRHPSHVDAGQDYGTATHGSSVLDETPTHGPVSLALQRTIRVYRPGILVVEKHRARSEKDSILEIESVEHEDAVLELAPVSDAHTLVDVDALSDVAFAPDDRLLTDLCLLPDACSRTDAGFVRDVRSWMDEGSVRCQGSPISSHGHRVRPSAALLGRVAIVNDVAGVARLEATGLRQAGWEVDFYDLRKPGASLPFLAKLLLLPVRLAMYLPVIFRLRSGKYDVVHVHFVSQGMVGAASGRPYFLHAHGSDLHLNFRNPLLRWWTRLWLGRARKIFYVTPNLASFLADYRTKTVFLPNPIDTQTFSDVKGPDRIAQVLVFMRIQAIKGARTVFEAARDIARVVRLSAIEWGPLAAEYKARYGDLVTFISPVPHDDVPELIGRFDAVIGQMEQGVPGLSELEAMAAGRVVVMRLDETLFPSDPPPVVNASTGAEIATRLGRLQGDPGEVRRLSLAGRSWVERNHGLADHTAKLSSEYRQAMLATA